MAAVLPVVPLTALPPGRRGLARDGGRARDARRRRSGSSSVRDWRIYGVVLLWPAVIEAIQTANASLPLTLLVALMWRYRDRAAHRRRRARLRRRGEALPLAARRLARADRPALARPPSRRRSPRRRCCSLLPFTSLADYVRLLRNLGETFEHEAYTPFALLTDLGVPDTAARAVDRRASGSACSRSPGAVAASASRSRPRSSSRRSCGVTSSPCSSCRSRSRVHDSTSCGSFPSAMWVGDGTFNGAPWQTACRPRVSPPLTFVLCERARGRGGACRRAPASPPRCRSRTR